MTTTMRSAVGEPSESPARDGRIMRGIAVLGVVLLAAVLDQASKEWALRDLEPGREIPVVPTVRLELFLNPGVAFGIGSDAGAPLVVGLILVMLGLLSWLAVRVIRRSSFVGTILLAIAAGGGVGNLIDRIARAENGLLTGRVVDFIAVEWFAVFNIADIFTTCGIALWALTQIRAPRVPVSS